MEKREEKNLVAEVAANWWAEKIYNINATDFDNGEDNAMMKMLAGLAAVQNTPNEYTVDKFKDRLYEVIKNAIVAGNGISLHVDYNPTGELATIARELGISDSVFPWKTVMWIDSQSVKVRAGYSAQVETLYPQEEHTN